MRMFSQLDRLCHFYASSSLENTRIEDILVLCQSFLNRQLVLGIIPCCASVIPEAFANTFEPRSGLVMQCIIEILYTMTPRFQYASSFVFHL